MSDEVEFWGQRMPRDWMEYLVTVQSITHYRDGESDFARVPYGSETFIRIADPSSIPCRHCNTIFGKLHEPDCDYEQCPKCSLQKMTCDCEFAEET